MEAAPHPWPALGALLLRDGLVNKEDLEEVLEQQRDSSRQRISGKRLGEALVDRGIVTSSQVAALVAEQYELPFVDLDESEVNLRVAALLPEEAAHRLSALPVSVLPDDSVLIVVSDPTHVLYTDELRRTIGRPLRFAVSTPDAIRAAIAFVERRRQEGWESGAATVGDVPTELHSHGEAEPASQPMLVVGGTPPPTALGALLVRDGVLTEDEVDAALAQQRLTGKKRLGEILVERGVVTRTQIAQLVAEQYELPFVELDESGVDLEAAALLDEETARRNSALPISFFTDGSLLVVVADPTNAVYADDLRLALDVPLRFGVADPDEVEAALTRAYGEVPADVAVEDASPAEPEASFESDDLEVEEVERATALEPPEDESDESTKDWEADVEETKEPHVEQVDAEAHERFEALATELEEEHEPEALEEREELDEPTAVERVTARAIETLGTEATEVEEAIERALALGATDIHFTPQPHAIVVRIRIDGVLRELETFPTSKRATISARLKLLGQLDAEDSHTTQEGRVVLDRGESATDLRIVVLPTAHGEKSTLHLLSEFSQPISLADLGMAADGEDALRRAITQPSGLVLVCGPAGNGCSTTLYAALRELNTAERALATIEEPVEQVIPGVDQVAVDPVAGLTYAAGLRAILLSDPDVILVGELPDPETTTAAVRAAVSGRLVLSRLDVESPADASERLVDLGVERGPVSATLSCVVAQRLVRRICPDCREPYYASAAEVTELSRPREEAGRRLLARGSGCVACGGTGFRGRVAIFEVLSVTDEIRGLLASGASTAEIEHAAISAGMRTFREEGIRLCLEGMTTVSELQRVAAEEEDRGGATAGPEIPTPTDRVDGASAPA